MSITRRSAGSPPRRVVMVVGGTSGIGLRVAQHCVDRGDAVVLVARDADRLREVADRLDRSGEQVRTAAADVVDASAVGDAVDTAVRRLGALDAVVTTAQSMAYGSVEQVPADALSRMTEVAVVGTATLASAVLPQFRRQGHGHLVVVGSLLSQIAVPSMGAYCAAKAGQHALVRTLQQEVRQDRGVHVSLVMPGAVDTPIYHQAATFAGSRGSAPPPVLSAGHHARAVLACLERPRRARHVGIGNRTVVTGYRFVPALYEWLAPRLVDLVVLRGPATDRHEGNLWEARPEREGPTGGWTLAGRLRGTSEHGATEGAPARPRWARR